MINDYDLDIYAQDCAREILKEVEKYGGDEYDLVHEHVDGSEMVIYYSKAHEVCQNCDTENGEQFYEDCGPWQNMTYDNIATIIAYGELQARIFQAMNELKGKDNG